MHKMDLVVVVCKGCQVETTHAAIQWLGSQRVKASKTTTQRTALGVHCVESLPPTSVSCISLVPGWTSFTLVYPSCH